VDIPGGESRQPGGDALDNLMNARCGALMLFMPEPGAKCIFDFGSSDPPLRSALVGAMPPGESRRRCGEWLLTEDYGSSDPPGQPHLAVGLSPWLKRGRRRGRLHDNFFDSSDPPQKPPNVASRISRHGPGAVDEVTIDRMTPARLVAWVLFRSVFNPGARGWTAGAFQQTGKI
jgi:hypothetical protein